MVNILPLERDLMRAARFRACLILSCALLWLVAFGGNDSIIWLDAAGGAGIIVTGSSDNFCAKSSAKLIGFDVP